MKEKNKKRFKKKSGIELYPKKIKRVMENRCPECGEEIEDDEFRDDISRTEHEMSGLCQKCQDEDFW